MSTVLSSKDGVRNRKRQYCCFCCEVIQPGELKDIRSGVSDGQFWTMHMHPECHQYEQMPGVVSDEDYEDLGMLEPVFSRADAIAKKPVRTIQNRKS